MAITIHQRYQPQLTLTLTRQPKVKKSEMTKNCPKDRLIIAREQAEEKAKKEGPNEKEEREKKKVMPVLGY